MARDTRAIETANRRANRRAERVAVRHYRDLQTFDESPRRELFWRDSVMKVRSIVCFLLLATSAGCFGHPIKSLERQAKRSDANAKRLAAQSFEDDRYLIPEQDALAAAAKWLGGADQLSEISPSRLATDWKYEGSIGVDATGEYYDEARLRREVQLTKSGAEIQASGQTLIETRRVFPSGRAREWAAQLPSTLKNPMSLEFGRLERLHVNGLRVGISKEGALKSFERGLPTGFSATTREGDALSAERITMVTKEKARKGLTARWDQREVIRASAASDPIQVDADQAHRFSTELDEGTWQAPSAKIKALAADWTVATARLGIPDGSLQFGPSLVPSVEPRNVALSDPPSPPLLRTMPQITELVTRRAWETRTGNFTVCLDRILVNPKDWNGEDWDVPGVDQVLGALQDTSAKTGAAMGELNAIADRLPIAGALADGGMAFLSQGAIDRRQLEFAAKATATVTGWTRQILPIAPEVAGGYGIGASSFQLKQTPDSLTSDQNICQNVDVLRGNLQMALEIWDLDASEHDPIGKCSFDFAQVADRGLVGIGCGFARVYMHATYNFSFDQIRIVGLPRP